jgi:hypothetical protein
MRQCGQPFSSMSPPGLIKFASWLHLCSAHIRVVVDSWDGAGEILMGEYYVTTFCASEADL